MQPQFDSQRTGIRPRFPIGPRGQESHRLGPVERANVYYAAENGEIMIGGSDQHASRAASGQPRFDSVDVHRVVEHEENLGLRVLQPTKRLFRGGAGVHDLVGEPAGFRELNQCGHHIGRVVGHHPHHDPTAAAGMRGRQMGLADAPRAE